MNIVITACLKWLKYNIETIHHSCLKGIYMDDDLKRLIEIKGLQMIMKNSYLM